ncbi:MAG: anthranilate synthase component I [Chloroflexi bacterium]|nr:anthranilate synthase component I [Chloroflexota bacterium]
MRTGRDGTGGDGTGRDGTGRDGTGRDACPTDLKPVFRELSADLETPVSVFLKLRNKGPCFLLESVERGEQLGRYSFIGTSPSLVLRSRGDKAEIVNGKASQEIPLGPPLQGPDVLHVLKGLLAGRQVAGAPGLPRFSGGAVGYLGYDVVSFFDKVKAPERDELGLPSAVFMVTDTMVIFDHVTQKMKIVAHASEGREKEAMDKIAAVVASLERPVPLPYLNGSLDLPKEVEFRSSFSKEEFMQGVAAAKGYIRAGDAFQIVLSQRLQRQTTAEPFSIYRALRMLNPSPYMFYLDFQDFQLIGSSPEMLVKLEGGQAETRPIAGTRPRGHSEAEDKAIIADLLADPKERAEHIMLVDLGRNDLGRVCQFGSVRVPAYMTTEKYSHVIHIVSSVVGELRPDYDAYSLLRASFPAGTLTGAPKIRAMEIIAELEKTQRGPYGGAVGYFGFSGNMDTCITIRTIVMKGDTVYLQGGAGIVADSDPETEYHESLRKLQALKEAVRIAEGKALPARSSAY